MVCIALHFTVLHTKHPSMHLNISYVIYNHVYVQLYMCVL